MLNISEVAERSGFSPSTLRFYDQIGLVKPAERTAAGYRQYDDGAVERLRFVERAKSLGLTLDEVAEVAELLDGDSCAPVQTRLRDLLADKIAGAQRNTTELIAFLGQLQTVAARLRGEPANGPCDDDCGCVSDSAEVASVPIAFTATPTAPDEEPIVCTLQPSNMDQRMGAWRSALAGALAREEVDGGLRLTLPRSSDIAALAELVVAEQTCCSFFTFTIAVTRDAISLEVTAPPDGLPVVHALVGMAA